MLLRTQEYLLKKKDHRLRQWDLHGDSVLFPTVKHYVSNSVNCQATLDFHLGGITSLTQNFSVLPILPSWFNKGYHFVPVCQGGTQQLAKETALGFWASLRFLSGLWLLWTRTQTNQPQLFSHWQKKKRLWGEVEHFWTTEGFGCLNWNKAIGAALFSPPHPQEKLPLSRRKSMAIKSRKPPSLSQSHRIALCLVTTPSVPSISRELYWASFQAPPPPKKARGMGWWAEWLAHSQKHSRSLRCLPPRQPYPWCLPRIRLCCKICW